MIGASVSVSNHYAVAYGCLVNRWGQIVDLRSTVSCTSSLDRSSSHMVVLFAGGLFSGCWRGCLYTCSRCQEFRLRIGCSPCL